MRSQWLFLLYDNPLPGWSRWASSRLPDKVRPVMAAPYLWLRCSLFLSCLPVCACPGVPCLCCCPAA